MAVYAKRVVGHERIEPLERQTGSRGFSRVEPPTPVEYGVLVQRCFCASMRFVSRLTITLDDDLHRALKETAARQGRSIASIIEESLRLRGIKAQASARELVAEARRRAQLGTEEALELAVEETDAVRGR